MSTRFALFSSNGILILFLILISITSYPQNIDEIKNAFPGSKEVYLKKEIHAYYGRKSGVLTLTTKHNTVTYFLDDNANLYTDRNIYYSGLITANNVDAKTVITVDGKEKIYRSSKVVEKDVVEPGIFYDDMKAMEIVFPNIRKGAKAVLSYDNIYAEPRLFGPVMLSSYIPIIESVCSVTAHKDLKIKYQYLGIDESKVSFTTTTDGDDITYTWVAKNLPAQKYEYNAPNNRYFEPQIILYVSEIASNTNYHGNQEGLYNWCYSFLKNINANCETVLKAPLDSLLKGASNDLEKSQRIFYWVQDNIKYVAFEDGYSGYIPRNAANVYTKRYGDCKDMANLITTLHKMAGLEAHHTWIGTRDIPYKIENLPMPCNFNHMISCAKIQDKWYFLDATGHNIRYGLPTSMIQNKEGLVSISADSFIVLKVPEIDYNENYIQDEITIELKDKLVEGHNTKTLKGFEMSSTLIPMLYRKKEDNDQYLYSLLTLGNNKCSVKNLQLPDNNYKSSEYKINYDFSIPDYALNLSSEIYVNLNLEKDLTEIRLDPATRKHDYEFDYKKLLDQKINLIIPRGYSVNYMPQNYSFNSDDFGFTISYENFNDHIVMHKRIYINTLLISPNKFESWNQMITKLTKAYKETISLKQK